MVLDKKKEKAQIKAIQDYIKEIIRLKGGNEYKEGSKKGHEKVAMYL